MGNGAGSTVGMEDEDGCAAGVGGSRVFSTNTLVAVTVETESASSEDMTSIKGPYECWHTRRFSFFVEYSTKCTLIIAAEEKAAASSDAFPLKCSSTSASCLLLIAVRSR